MIDIAKSELSVISKAKDLCSYIMTVTDKSPKRFRFTLVSRLQNYALDVIENLIMANETFVSTGDMRSAAMRMSFQRTAMSRLKLLSYMSELAMKQGCILPKQYELITKQVYDAENMLGAWMNSDKRRYQGAETKAESDGEVIGEKCVRSHARFSEYVPGVQAGGYHQFMIYDPKERKIEALSFRDRVVQHCLCDNILKPYFENRLIYDNAACREGKGTDFARDRLTGFLREHYRKHGTKGYILKYDIRHYFDSIDHEILKGMLKNIPDRNVLGLLYHIIRSHEGSTDAVTGRKRGLPLGNQTSQWFALYYLDPMDRLVKEKMRIKHYIRYMDDGVLIHESKEYLNEVLARMREKAKELNLEFNQKTQIVPISEGVDFLGFRFYLTDSGKVIRRLRTSNKRRWKRRLKKYKEEYRVRAKSYDEIKRSIVSYNGHLAHGHTWKLRKKVMGSYVLTHAPKNESEGDDIWY